MSTFYARWHIQKVKKNLAALIFGPLNYTMSKYYVRVNIRDYINYDFPLTLKILVQHKYYYFDIK